MTTPGHGDDLLEVEARDGRSQARPHQVVQSHLGRPLVSDGLNEGFRIRDLPHRVAVDAQVLLVLGQELGAGRIVDPQPAVVEADLVHQGHLDLESRIGDRANRLAELRHERELGLADGEQSRPREHEGGDEP